MIGRLKRVPLREVWPGEARDFTPWLQNNLDLLNEELGLTLSSAEREQAAGDFSVDLVAEDESGNPVVIENQLGRSDHDHLGKVITYLAAIEASTAVWIVAEPRPEHVSAIAWLNESSSAHFYLVKVEAVQIGNSEPAPLLTLILGPSYETEEAGETKREFSERHNLRYQFWTELLESARPLTDLHANISPGHDSWVAAGAGITGVSFQYVIRQHDARVQLYIDRGRDTKEENKSIFDQLYQHKEDIEYQFGESLIWDRFDENRGSIIRKAVSVGGYRDENREASQQAMIDTMIRFEAALRPYLNQVRI